MTAFLYEGKYYTHDVAVGDIVERHTPAAYGANLRQGQKGTVTEVKAAKYSHHESVGLTQQAVYVPHVKLRLHHQSWDDTSWYSMNNLTVVDVTGRKGNAVSKVLAIEVDRPTFVREFTETAGLDGKIVREYVGDWLPFDNVSAAQVYTSAQISNSIRESNTYRKFSIVQEKAIARAKNPEIEFA